MDSTHLFYNFNINSLSFSLRELMKLRDVLRDIPRYWASLTQQQWHIGFILHNSDIRKTTKTNILTFNLIPIQCFIKQSTKKVCNKTLENKHVAYAYIFYPEISKYTGNTNTLICWPQYYAECMKGCKCIELNEWKYKPEPLKLVIESFF